MAIEERHSWGWTYFSGDGEAYQYLPPNAAAFPCGAKFEEFLANTGWVPRKTISLCVCGGVCGGGHTSTSLISRRKSRSDALLAFLPYALPPSLVGALLA